MKKILIASQKGGVSKSVLTICIGYCLAQNYKVCLVDTDTQNSLNNFKDLISLDIVDKSELKKDNYDCAIIDSSPYLSTKLPELIRQADYVLIPCRPNYFDLVALKGIIELLPQGKKAGIVLTQVQHRVNITDIIESLREYQIPVIKQHMSHRVSYARVGMQNLFKSDDVKAQKEILSIVLEIFAQI